MRTEAEIRNQITICDIDIAENDHADIRSIMARAQRRAFLWMLEELDDNEL